MVQTNSSESEVGSVSFGLYTRYDLALRMTNIIDVARCAQEVIKFGTPTQRMQLIHLLECVYFCNAAAACEGASPPSQTTVHKLFSQQYDVCEKYFREQHIPRAVDFGLIMRTPGKSTQKLITLTESGRTKLEDFRYLRKLQTAERAIIEAANPGNMSESRIRELRARFKSHVSLAPEEMLDAVERSAGSAFIVGLATS